MSNGKVKSVVTAPVNYIVNANGSMTSDGLREFDYDAANRLAKVTVSKDGEAARVVYLTNAMGQRVFKSVTQAEQTLPNETTLDAGFIAWLKKSFGWLFTASSTTTGAGLGTAYVYGDGPIPAWAMLGEYDNGSAVGKGRTEYIWLPTQDGQALPVGMYRNGKFYAVHADHLGTPRLITDEANKPVWQWPYSAFGNNMPTGVLQATPNPKQAITNQPVLLKASKPIEMNLRFPGQYFDAETGLFYNWHRYYSDKGGRYIQSDRIGLDGGMNLFGYVNGRPTMLADPTGKSPTAVLGAEIGFALGGPVGSVIGAGVGMGVGYAITNWAWNAGAAMSASNSDDQAKWQAIPLIELCSKCKATDTRAQAQAKAWAWAGISPMSSTPMQWDAFNPPGGRQFKKSRAWAEFRAQYGAANFGGYLGTASVEEHPFGHPDLPGGQNHDCPHFVAVNSQGLSQEFPYQPGSN